jgi:hypothetical protein
MTKGNIQNVFRMSEVNNKVQGTKYKEQERKGKRTKGTNINRLSLIVNRYFRVFALLFTLPIITVPLSAQQVTNVEASFNREKAEVTVSCYLESAKPRYLILYYSKDNGSSWEYCVSVSGNIKDQMTGEKKIMWNPAIDGIAIGMFLFKVTGILGIEMVFVQGGTFSMGCTNEQGEDCDNDEKPVHQVTLSSFYIGKYEITQAQWETIMGNNPSYIKGGDLPVENVSWEEAQEFIKRLNAATGKKYRLPTEAEWEYAARGGNQSRGYKYSGNNYLSEVAWYYTNSGSTTHPVGTKKANELGIYDMSGNVLEWCSDWFGNYGSSAQTNPVGASYGSDRVFRGGSWYDITSICRVAYRNYFSPGNRSSIIGFRVTYSSK